MKNLDESYAKELLLDLKKLAEARNWHLKYAKFNRFVHQSLLSHSLNVASLSYSIVKCLDELGHLKATERLELQSLLTGFLHDAGKETDRFQRAVFDFLEGNGPEPLDFGHQQERDIIPIVNNIKLEIGGRFEILPRLQNIWNEILWSVTQLGRRENAAAVSHSFKGIPSKEAVVCAEIVHLADLIMSMRSIEEASSIRPDGEFISKLCLVYSKVSAVRGVLTQFLHAALEEQFVKQGFHPVQWYPNGTLFLGDVSMKAPTLEQSTLIESIINQMRNSLDKSQPSRLAKAAFGGLTVQVIAAPEFLFGSDKVIRSFWHYVSRQRFATPRPAKKVSELSDTEKSISELFRKELKNNDEQVLLTHVARFSADFNLLIVLYAARKQLLDNILGSSERRSVEEETRKRMTEVMSGLLGISPKSMSEWPEIALQTRAGKRISVARTLWQSSYYSNLNVWQKKLVNALEKTTIELAKLWKEHVPDKYRSIAQLLLADVSSPVSIGVLDEIKDLIKVMEIGKQGRGTQVCEKCGSVASIEAQASLFGKSEIYHDHLVAGKKVGGGNKIKVCQLCEFEEKLRTLFIENGRPVLIFPQLALSRHQMVDWQGWANRIKYGDGQLPSVMKLERWSELLLNEQMESVSIFSEGELTYAIQRVIDEFGLSDDLSLLLEPPADATSAKEVARLIREGKYKLKEQYSKQVNVILYRVEPIYISPNYILLLASGSIGRKGEPESSEAIKWILFRCILARLFHATILDANSPFVEEGVNLGYTTIPANVSLKGLAQKLNARKGWIPISELESASRKLSALMLLSRELYYSDGDYGASTLLRLIDEEAGRTLVRITSKGNVKIPKKVISYLDVWVEKKNANLF